MFVRIVLLDWVLVGNKIDLAHKRKVPAADAQALADKYGMLPEGHLGYPYHGSGYIFMDEIQIR
jgi:hypothetical protein